MALCTLSLDLQSNPCDHEQCPPKLPEFQERTVVFRRRRLLPLLQVVLAAVLTIHNLAGSGSIENPSWPQPDRQFRDALNAPATLVRVCLLQVTSRAFPGGTVELLMETVVNLLLIWLLWFFVALEMDGQGRSVLARKLRFGRVVDTGAVVFGIGLVGSAILAAVQFGSVNVFSILVATPYALWGGLVIVFYRRDLERAGDEDRASGGGSERS
jgi:hypothetical protein